MGRFIDNTDDGCFDCFPHPGRVFISYYNILWAELQSKASDKVVLTYAKQTAKHKLCPTTITVQFSDSEGVVTTAPSANPEPGVARSETLCSLGSSDGLLSTTETNVKPNVVVKTSTPSSGSTLPPSTLATVIEDILDRAFHKSKRNKHFLVLINPNGGPGKARQIYASTCAPMLKAGRCKVTVIETQRRYHALEIARDTPDIMKYDGIICCSGDGTPHEIINGLSARPNDAAQVLANLPLCQLPCGSGNSVAISLNGNNSPTVASLAMVKGVPMPVDLMLVTQGDTKFLSFLTQAFGTIADADLGTEHLRWMGGTRFVFGTLQHTMQATTYPCDLYVKYAQKTTGEMKEHYNTHLQRHKDWLDQDFSLSSRSTTDATTVNGDDANGSVSSLRKTNDLFAKAQYGSINDPLPSDWSVVPDGEHLSLMYCGKMPWVSSDCLMFPATLPMDGTMDMFLTHTNHMSRFEALKMLASMERGNHVYLDYVEYSKVVAYRLVPKRQSGHLSFDGEQYPYTPFQVEVLPSVGCLLSNNGIWTLTGFGDE